MGFDFWLMDGLMILKDGLYKYIKFNEYKITLNILKQLKWINKNDKYFVSLNI